LVKQVFYKDILNLKKIVCEGISFSRSLDRLAVKDQLFMYINIGTPL